jgi:nucleotide-binding universal stress UspA family protein
MQAPMKKILVPVDFSDHTDITCRYALEYAKAYGAKILLFHTYFDQIIIADTSFPDTLDMSTIYNEELMKEIFRQAERNMAALEETLDDIIKKEGISNVGISSKVTGGEIGQELKEICKEFLPDLVVMGTTGKGNNLNIWGKVSTFIIDHAKIPVITVPDMKNFQGFGTIMLAADLSEGNAATISDLFSLFSAFSFRIKVVHFVTKPKESDAYLRMKALQMKFGKELKTNTIDFEVVEVEDDNQKAVDQYVINNKVDMIAFLPHKRSLLYMFFTKNITKKNLFAANVPLLAIPGKA